LNYEEIRRSYAELMGYEYIPIPMSDDKYYKLDNNKTEQTQPSITSQNPTISQKNTTSKRVTFDNNPPQRFRGGKNNTKRNRHR
jgi:hypothetical protein